MVSDRPAFERMVGLAFLGLVLAAASLAPFPAAAASPLTVGYKGELNTPDEDSGDGFGSSMAVSGDILFVGSESYDVPSFAVGRVDMFQLQPETGDVAHVSTINAPEDKVILRFGRDLAISGEYLVVGCHADAAFLYKFDGETLAVEFRNKMVDPMGRTGIAFGTHVAIAGRLVAVSSHLAATGGEVATFFINETEHAEARDQQTGVDTVSGNGFGSAVSLSPDGNYLFVGAPYQSSFANRGGAVYGLNVSTTALVPANKVGSPSPYEWNLFGDDIEQLGNLVAIGEVGGSLDAGVTRTGMVHLYTLGDDGSLTWASTIVPQAGYDNGDFGFSMSLSGNVLLVGARRDHEAASTAGAAYVYSVNTSVPDEGFVFEDKILAPKAKSGHSAGATVSIFGNLLLVDSQGFNIPGLDMFYFADDVPAPPTPPLPTPAPPPAPTGPIYRQRVVPPETSRRNFGVAAALDGDLLVVSTIDDTVFISQGLFQVFVRGGPYGQFEWIGSFQPPNSTFPNDVGFASAVAGNVILTSDPSTSGVVGDDEGTVFRFEFHPGTRTISYEQSFKAPDPSDGAKFGAAIAMDGDGTIVVGAPFADSTGAIYLFDSDATGDATYQTKAASPTGPGQSSEFGGCLAMDGDFLVGCSFGNDSMSLWQLDRVAGTLTLLDTVAGTDDGLQLGFAGDVAIAGGVVAVSTGNGAGPVLALLYSVTGGRLVYIDSILAPDAPLGWTAAGDGVASLAMSGSLLVVGDGTADYGSDQTDAGLVYVFQVGGGASNASATHLKTLTPTIPIATGDFGGPGVAVDGTTVVGLFPELESARLNCWDEPESKVVHDATGGALIFDISTAQAETFVTGGGPSLGYVRYSGTVAALDAEPSQAFGTSVAVGGSWVVVGAPGDEISLQSEAGAVYLYRLDPSTGELVYLDKTADQTPAEGARFGAAVAIVGDVVLVGASGNAAVAGQVSLFRINPHSGVLDWQQTFTDPTHSAAGDGFGFSLDTDGEADGYFVVGAPADDAVDYGRVSLWSHNATTGMVAYHDTMAAAELEDDRHGYAVAIDAGLVAVGAPDAHLNSDPFIAKGHVYLLRINETDQFEAGQVARGYGDDGAGFGFDVDLRGNLLLAGEPFPSGTAYLFHVDPLCGAVTLLTRLETPGTTAGSHFGSSVLLLSSSLFAVGATADDTVSGNGGAVFVFAYDDATTDTSLVDSGFAANPGINDGFGNALALDGDLLVVAGSDVDVDEEADAGSVTYFNLSPPTVVLTVDAAYCEVHGGPWSGQCIEEALDEAQLRRGVIGTIAIAPGTYTGCSFAGQTLSRRDLLVTTTSYPDLPPANEAEVVWSCDNDSGRRHLHLDASFHISFAGIAFASSNVGPGKSGGVALIERSENVTFEACAFRDASAGVDGGAIRISDSVDVSVVDSVATNVEAPAGRGGFVMTDSGLVMANTNVTGASANLGGVVYLGGGESTVRDSFLTNCSAGGFGGCLFIATQSGDDNALVDHVEISNANAGLSGGGIFVDAGSSVATVVISDSTVLNSVAGSSGGGVAVRAVNLVDDVGTRTVAVTGSQLVGNRAHRGGGLFSEVDTVVTSTAFASNTAEEAGGGAAFQPSPCLTAAVVVSGSTFDGNAASSLGGGVYALSVDLAVTASAFTGNAAISGGAVSTDCAAEVCVGQRPRDLCASQVSTVASSDFVANLAVDDGAAIYVSNHRLEVTTAGSAFPDNNATRGAVVFADTSATVVVDGLVGGDANEALDAGTSAAFAYGNGLASPPQAAYWLSPPMATGSGSDPPMAGSNLCETANCTISLTDAYSNTVTTPVVVEIVPLSNAVALVDAPEFVLVTGGQSAVIPAVRIYAVGSLDVPPPPTVVASFGLQHIGSSVTVGVLNASASSCDVGWGAIVDSLAGNALTCELCPVGTFADDVSWAACAACEAGTTTVVAGGNSCDWCEAGFGWNSGASACQLCPVDFFSGAATFQSACQACPGGAATDGSTGATACNSPLICQPGEGSIVVGGARACAACGVGTYNPNTTVEACAVCPDGTTTNPDAVGATACDWCSVGFGVVVDGAECEMCPSGTYAENATRSDNCTICDGEVQIVGGLPLACIEAEALNVDIPALALTGGFVIVLLVAVFVSVFVRKADGAVHATIATIVLSIYDVTTDYLFLFQLVDLNKQRGVDVTTLIIVSLGSLAVAFVTNSMLTVFILLHERRQKGFIKYMRENTAAVAVVSLISTTNVAALEFLSSKVFNIGATTAPMTPSAHDMIQMGGVASVLFEDIPQLVVSVLFLTGDDGSPSAIVLLSIFASSLGIINGVIMRLVLCCVITSDEPVDEDPLEETYDQYDDAHNNPPSSSPSKLSMLESGGSSLSSSSSSASRSSGSTSGSSLSMAGSSS